MCFENEMRNTFSRIPPIWKKKKIFISNSKAALILWKLLIFYLEISKSMLHSHLIDYFHEQNWVSLK